MYRRATFRINARKDTQPVTTATHITRTTTPVVAPKRIRVAAYARISETKGNTPASLSAQVSYYNDLISKTPQWEFAGVYSDAGATGTNLARPGFQALLEAARAGDVDVILTKSISRFARNTVILLETVRELRNLGVEVRFERENISTFTADGELMLSILASFAQEEAWSTSANVKWGIRKNFERGITNQMCVYGYIWTGDEFVINERQAEAVQFIYRRFLEGTIYADIIRECEAAGYEAYRGGRFTTAALKMILRQERYTGNTLLGKSFNPYPGHHGMKNTGQAPMFFAEGTNPRIIDQATFDAAQVALAQRTKANKRSAHNQTVTVFSGNVWCGACQARANRAVNRWDGVSHPVWRCPRRAKGKPASCEGGAVRESRLKEITCLITGKASFTDDLFARHVKQVVIWSPCMVRFHLRDERVLEVTFTKGRYATALTAADLVEVTT